MITRGEGAAQAPEPAATGRGLFYRCGPGLAFPTTSRQAVATAYHAPVPDDQVLFAHEVERVLPAAYRFRGDRPPYTRWPDSRKN